MTIGFSQDPDCVPGQDLRILSNGDAVLGRSNVAIPSTGELVGILSAYGAAQNTEQVVIAISCTIIDPAAPPGLAECQVVAEIEFGSGCGAHRTLMVDVTRGVQITVAASSVSIGARVVQDPGGAELPGALLTANLSWGCGPPDEVSTLTLPPVDIPALGTAEFKIPLFASRQLLWAATAFGGATFQLRGGTGAGSRLYFAGLVSDFAFLTTGGGLTLPGGARWLRLIAGAAPVTLIPGWTLNV